MRRKDREITDIQEIMELLRQCTVCRIAMVNGDRPYVLPLNFGAEQIGESITIYLHCAKEGRKLDILRQNPKVCFEADCEHELIEAEKACNYGYYFASVLGEGKAEILENATEKEHGLSVLMEHQTKQTGFVFGDTGVASVCVLRIRLDSVSGKRHGK